MEKEFAPRLSAPVTRASFQTARDTSAAVEQSMTQTTSWQPNQSGGFMWLSPFADDAD